MDERGSVFLLFFVTLLYSFFAETAGTSDLACDIYRRRPNVHNLNEIDRLYVLANYRLPRKYYIDVLGKNVSCPICNDSGQIICLRKCCLRDDSFNATAKKCKASPSSAFASFVGYYEKFAPANIRIFADVVVAGNYNVLYGSLCASHVIDISRFKLSESGQAYVDNEPIQPSEYCVDYFLDSNEFGVLECAKTKQSLSVVDFRVTLCFVCSVFCLSVTICVYAYVDKLRALLPNKILLCYVINLLITYAIYITLRIFSIHGGTFCIVATLVVQFTFLASFFWLNVMCFDLWFAFSGYRSFNGSPKERDLKKFLVYCLYAWGCPALIVAATIFAEFYPYLPRNFIRPGFGKHKCYFDTTKAEFIYFYGFVSLIVFSNLFMFISTAFILKKHKKEAKVFKRSGSRRHLHHHNESFNLYLKLFIVMGANWMMEVMSFYLPLPNEIWLVSDLLNASQGVLIFVIFVLKRRIFNLVKKRLLPHRPFVGGSRSKKTSFNTVTSVISLASVRGGAGAGTSGGVVSPKSPPVQSAAADQLEVEVAC